MTHSLAGPFRPPEPALDTARAEYLASTQEAFGTDPTAGARIPLTATGILHGGAAFDTNGDYVAAAGTYMLKLIAKGNDGGCVGNATFFRPSLGYMLVGS